MKHFFMRRVYYLTAFLFLAGFSCAPAASSEPPFYKNPHEKLHEKLHEKIDEKIDQLVRQKKLKKSSLGIAVLKNPSSTKTPVYELNSDRLFIPASLTKIASLSALFHYYPPWLQFQSLFLSSAASENGQLKGDLVFKGGGDPSFTSESLWNLVNAFTRSGFSEIKGDILIDDSLYENLPPPSLSERSYAAPISAASFNWNSVTFRIRPGKQPSSPARIFVDPENSYIKVINKVKTESSAKTRITVKRISASPRKEVFQLSGIISIAKTEAVKYRNIKHPTFWLGRNILSFLSQRGIQVKGTVKKGRCAEPCRVLAEWKSRAFSFQAGNMMKFSNNFAARMLAAHLPLLKGASKGNPDKGVKWLNRYLRTEAGLKNYRLIEPSGLSRGNRFSPNHFQTLLTREASRFYFPEILSSYPLAGGIGTLKHIIAAKPESKNFLKSPETAAGTALAIPENSEPVFIRAKTGSLSGVLGLAGYAKAPAKNPQAKNTQTKNPQAKNPQAKNPQAKNPQAENQKQRYIFTFLFNGKPQKAPHAQALFHEILSLLLNQKVRAAAHISQNKAQAILPAAVSQDAPKTRRAGY